jgi:hypothetical protein
MTTSKAPVAAIVTLHWRRTSILKTLHPGGEKRNPGAHKRSCHLGISFLDRPRRGLPARLEKRQEFAESICVLLSLW